MYLQRNIFVAKPGCLGEAVELVQGEVESSRANAIVLTPYVGPIDQGVLEIKFHTLSEYEQFWQTWLQSPGAGPFIQNYDPLILPGGRKELWQIREPREKPHTGKMINRRTYKVKIGMIDEAVNLLLAIRNEEQRFEITTPEFGDDDVLALAFEFDTMEEYDQGWSNWESSPEAAEFNQKWNQLIEMSISNEIWCIR